MYVHSGRDSLISQETLQNYVTPHHFTTTDPTTPNLITSHPTTLSPI